MSTKQEVVYKVHCVYDVDVNKPVLKSYNQKLKFLLIISHIDIDGVITGYLLSLALKEDYDSCGVIFTKPNDVNKLQNYLQKLAYDKEYQDYDVDTAFVDVSINQTSSGMTINFLDYLVSKWRLRYVVDHHIGWEPIINNYRLPDFTYIFNNEVMESDPDIDYSIPSAPNTKEKGLLIINTGKDAIAAATIVYNLFTPKEEDREYVDRLIVISKLADDLAYNAGFLAKLNQSTTSSQSSLLLKAIYDSYTHLRGLDVVDQLRALCDRDIAGDSEWYIKKFAEAQNYISRIRDVTPPTSTSTSGKPNIKIGSLQLMYDSNINRTMLFSSSYSVYDYLILSEVNPKKMSISYTLGTKLSTNLVDVFDLDSGSPKKISIPKSYVINGVDDVVSRISEYHNNNHLKISDNIVFRGDK